MNKKKQLRYVKNFKFTKDEIDYLRDLYGDQCEERFFEYLSSVDCSEVKIYAIPEGTVVFPRQPLLRVEGPVLICQLLETALLNLVNYPSLVATNAARHRFVAGNHIKLVEFGLRRAQGSLSSFSFHSFIFKFFSFIIKILSISLYHFIVFNNRIIIIIILLRKNIKRRTKGPDGAMSATRYSYLGGFDGTSNVQGGKLFGIKPSGTHAHAFVSSFISDEVLSHYPIKDASGNNIDDFGAIVLQARDELKLTNTNQGELLAFTAFARSFPRSTLLLVDTYDTVHSGVPNFIIVAYALHKIGYQAKGIRLDSGDLAYLSRVARSMFKQVLFFFNLFFIILCIYFITRQCASKIT